MALRVVRSQVVAVWAFVWNGSSFAGRQINTLLPSTFRRKSTEGGSLVTGCFDCTRPMLLARARSNVSCLFRCEGFPVNRVDRFRSAARPHILHQFCATTPTTPFLTLSARHHSHCGKSQRNNPPAIRTPCRASWSSSAFSLLHLHWLRRKQVSERTHALTA